MKTVFYSYSCILGICMLLNSCSQKLEIIEPNVSLLSADIISVDYKQSVSTISFVSNCEWSIYPTESWISVNHTSGGPGTNSVTVSILENPGGEREGFLNLEYKSFLIIIRVIQSETIGLSKNVFELSAEGGDIEIEVQSMSRLSCYSEVDWISSINTPEVGQPYKFHVSANESRESRSGIITFSHQDSKSEVIVNQSGADVFIVSNRFWEVPCDGKTIEVKVSSNAGEPTISIPSDVDWIKDITTKTIQSYKHTLYVSRNRNLKSRTAKINISSEDGKLSDFISIVQSQLDTLIVDTDKILLPAEGGEHSITISTNTKFTVSTNANWLSTSIEKGDLDDRLIVGAQVNKTNNTRDAKLTISYATKCIDILISQSCSEDTFWGDVILNNLEDVKSFGGKGYKVINGNFIVEHTSLQQLGNTIEHVEGNVSLQLSSYNIWQQREYNCDGLYGLKTIGGSLIIDWISNPNQLEGLNNIQSVGKNVTITTSTL